MTRDWESAFSFWARPPSKTEEQRSENAIGAIRNPVNGSSTLKQRKIKVFTQGSYRNRVNVRQDSDVDVGVMLYYDSFLDEYPEGKTRADFGNIDGDYHYSQFKNELEEAMVDHFGRAAVKRGNKAFNIRENTYAKRHTSRGLDTDLGWLYSCPSHGAARAARASGCGRGDVTARRDDRIDHTGRERACGESGSGAEGRARSFSNSS